MSNSLTLDELKYLSSNFRFDIESEENALISFEKLIDPVFFEEYLVELQEHFGTDKKFVAASQLGKRLGFAVAIPILYAMTIYDKKVDVSLSNCFLVEAFSGDQWMPKLFLKNTDAIEPELSDRLLWRESIIEGLFKYNLTPILQNISAISRIPKVILWENIAIYVYWLYEQRIQDGVQNGLKRQILSDFYYLIHQAPGCFFGEVENPLKKFFGAMCELPFLEEPVRIRKTCCFYCDIAPNGECCSTCPKGKREMEQYKIS